MAESQLYQCLQCGLHYTSKKTAEECEAFCKKNSACSLEITQHSLEAQNKTS